MFTAPVACFNFTESIFQRFLGKQKISFINESLKGCSYEIHCDTLVITVKEREYEILSRTLQAIAHLSVYNVKIISTDGRYLTLRSVGIEHSTYR